MPKVLDLSFVAAILLMLPAVNFAQNTYDINVASIAPTVDGIVSPGEWADAAGEQAGWRILRDASGPADAHNNRFRMMWDATHLYVLAESDYGDWTTDQRDQFRGSDNNLNLYFDPDLDGEGNQGNETAPFHTPDGYRIAINQYAGTYGCASSCSVDHDDNPSNGLSFGEAGSNLSTYAAAHIDQLFGNSAQWLGMRGTRIGTINGASGGVVEMAIPWTDFDAPGLDANGLDPGLNLNGASPSDGDLWNFNIAQLTTDDANPVPIWNWHTDPSGSEFFSSQPHGVVRFVGSAAIPEPCSLVLLLSLGGLGLLPRRRGS